MYLTNERVKRASIEGFNTLLNLYGNRSTFINDRYGNFVVYCLIKQELREEDLNGDILHRSTITVQYLLDDYPYSDINRIIPSGMSYHIPSNIRAIQEETMGIGTIMAISST